MVVNGHKACTGTETQKNIDVSELYYPEKQLGQRPGKQHGHPGNDFQRAIHRSCVD